MSVQTLHLLTELLDLLAIHSVLPKEQKPQQLDLIQSTLKDCEKSPNKLLTKYIERASISIHKGDTSATQHHLEQALSELV